MILNRTEILFVILSGLFLIWQDAQSDELLVHVASKHMQTSGLNEVNFGVGYGRTLGGHTEARVGVYNNSYERTSVYAAVSVHTNGYVQAGVLGGVVTGYNNTPVGAGPVTPYALPTSAVQNLAR